MPTPPEEPKAGAPEWLVTFGDMMTLLLCFFVLLLSFSTMEVERFKVVAGYIRQAFGVQLDRRYTEIPAGNTVVSVEFNPPSQQQQDLIESIVATMRQMKMENLVEVEEVDEGVRIRIDGSLVFRPGSAEIQREAMPFLDHVAELVRKTGGGAEVAGHTDNVPIRSDRFPSNWELSSARAGAVVRYLVSRGVPPRGLEAIGYADTEPLTDNFTETGRRRNRRVEIVVKTPPGSESE